MALFQRLKLNDWRQFAELDIDLSNQTTVLTGSNGSGKTTVLNTLSHHFGWNLPFVSTPYLGKRTAKRLWSDIYQEDQNYYFNSDEIPNDKVQIGSIEYDTGSDCKLLTSRFVTANYQIEYGNIHQVHGLFIPSHRPVAVYFPVDQIPTNPVSAQKHYQDFTT